MAAGDTTQGRRLPDVTWGEGGWTGWTDARPGDYVKVLDAPKVIENPSTPGAGWYIKDPRGVVGSLRNHTITEHEDGTISVTPSILDSDPRPASEQMGGELGAIVGPGWHGFLERGVWREV